MKTTIPIGCRRYWLAFTHAELVEFAGDIATAQADDLPRHANRIDAALRLGCFKLATYRDLTARLEARRAQLASTATPDTPVPERAE